MPERDAVLFCNEAFYRAVNDRDVTALEDLWAADGPVSCLHPGWPAIIGRDQVLSSWRRILSHDASPKIVCREPVALLQGDVGIVICYEDVEGQLLVATNVFRRVGRHWRMIHHQAGPTAAELGPAEEEPDAPARPN